MNEWPSGFAIVAAAGVAGCMGRQWPVCCCARPLRSRLLFVDDAAPAPSDLCAHLKQPPVQRSQTMGSGRRGGEPSCFSIARSRFGTCVQSPAAAHRSTQVMFEHLLPRCWLTMLLHRVAHARDRRGYACNIDATGTQCQIRTVSFCSRLQPPVSIAYSMAKLPNE